MKMIKNSSAKYYQDSKERLHKKAHERYQSLFEEKNEKKKIYDLERYKTLSKDEK